MRRHHFTSLAVVTTALATLTGCNSFTVTPPPPPELVQAEAGKPFEIETADGGTAKVSVELAEYSKKLEGTLLDIPKAHEGYLVIDMEWETVKGTTVPSHASVIARSEGGYSAIPELQKGGQLSTQPLAKGEKSKAKLAFSVPKAPTVIEVGAPELKQRVKVTVKP